MRISGGAKLTKPPSQSGNCFSLDNFSLIKTASKEFEVFVQNAPAFSKKKYEKGFFVNDISFRTDKPEELAVINYTSGTTSSPKGVMIPYRSLWSNTKFANDNLEFIFFRATILYVCYQWHIRMDWLLKFSIPYQWVATSIFWGGKPLLRKYCSKHSRKLNQS